MKIPNIKTVMQRSGEYYPRKQCCGQQSEEGGRGLYIWSLTDEIEC
jgi:hypothetical protein